MSIVQLLAYLLTPFFLLASPLSQAMETPNNLDEIDSVEMVFSKTLGVYQCPRGYDSIQSVSKITKCIPKAPFIYPDLTGSSIDTPEQCFAAHEKQREDLAYGGKIFGGGGAAIALLEPISLAITLPIIGWVSWQAHKNGDRLIGKLVQERGEGLPSLKKRVRRKTGYSIPEWDLALALENSLNDLSLCPRTYSQETVDALVELHKDAMAQKYSDNQISKAKYQRSLHELSLEETHWRNFRKPIRTTDEMIEMIIKKFPHLQ